jgi:hypothetical protein
MNNPYASAATENLSHKSGETAVQTLVRVSVEPANFIGPQPLSTNNWDNGAKGNYWSDYYGTDANGDGIGDTAHYLYGNNQDNYPLMRATEPAISEFPTWVILPLLAMASVYLLAAKRRSKTDSETRYCSTQKASKIELNCLLRRVLCAKFPQLKLYQSCFSQESQNRQNYNYTA